MISNKFTFQVYSDLHLENRDYYPKIPQKANNLFLCGDIGKINDNNFKEFINYVSTKWEKIFIILGNHEYYLPQSHFTKIKQQFKKFYESYNNIYFLDKDVVIFKELLVIGATFWSQSNIKIKNIINDFNKIKYFDAEKQRKFLINVEFINKIHNQEKRWLKEILHNVISYTPKKKVIIMSHFPLTQYKTLHPIYNKQSIELKNYFANDFEKILFDFSNTYGTHIIQLGGHTHFR